MRTISVSSLTDNRRRVANQRSNLAPAMLLKCDGSTVQLVFLYKPAIYVTQVVAVCHHYARFESVLGLIEFVVLRRVSYSGSQVRFDAWFATPYGHCMDKELVPRLRGPASSVSGFVGSEETLSRDHAMLPLL